MNWRRSWTVWRTGRRGRRRPGTAAERGSEPPPLRSVEAAVAHLFGGCGRRRDRVGGALDRGSLPRPVTGCGGSPSRADAARSAAGEECGEGPSSPRKRAERIAQAIRAAIRWGKRPASAGTTGFPISSRTDSHAGRSIHRLMALTSNDMEEIGMVRDSQAPCLFAAVRLHGRRGEERRGAAAPWRNRTTEDTSVSTAA